MTTEHQPGTRCRPTRMRALTVLYAVGLASVVGTAGTAGADGSSKEPNPSLAVFGDRIIDLRVSWEDATACASDGSSTFCFLTAAERDDFVATDPFGAGDTSGERQDTSGGESE